MQYYTLFFLTLPASFRRLFVLKVQCNIGSGVLSLLSKNLNFRPFELLEEYIRIVWMPKIKTSGPFIAINAPVKLQSLSYTCLLYCAKIKSVKCKDSVFSTRFAQFLAARKSYVVNLNLETTARNSKTLVTPSTCLLYCASPLSQNHKIVC